MVLRDEVEQIGHEDARITMRVVAGHNEGLLITQRFEEVAGKGTRVTATLDTPARGLMKLFAPLLKMGMTRTLRDTLEQDRIDLEERAYSAS
jgi:hypothetical protein